jgi:hypothetical protein
VADIVPKDGKVGLTWAPIPGVTDYRIFRTSSPDIDFDSEPVADVTMLAPRKDGWQRAVVSGLVNGIDGYYAISSIIDGKPTMVHRLLLGSPAVGAGLPTITFSYDTPSGDNHACVKRDVTVTVTVTDRFGIQDLTTQVGDKTYSIAGNAETSGDDLKNDGDLSISYIIPDPVRPAAGSVTVTALATSLAGGDARVVTSDECRQYLRYPKGGGGRAWTVL